MVYIKITYKLFYKQASMKEMNKKIIITLGPSTMTFDLLRKLKKKKVDLFRINLSHTSLNDLPKVLNKLREQKISPICIDTEGAQIRTFGVKKHFYKIGQKIIITNTSKKINKRNVINLYPKLRLKNFVKGTKVLIGFENLKIEIISSNEKFPKAKVINEGLIENNKGVHVINKDIKLSPLTEKDIQSIKIAKKYNIKNFALSFANDLNSINIIKKCIGKNDKLISKIETKKGFINRKKIISASNTILIDRGDLSRYIPIEKIPLAQKMLTKECVKQKTELFIATNLLETMINDKNPTRAESNDIYNSLVDGASGLVLAAETAIGKFPLECVDFLKKCIRIFTYSKNKKNFLFK
jgi:pyruvate kinase